MSATVVRAVIEPIAELGDTSSIQLVVSVNPFSSIKYPRQGAPAAHYQRYHVYPNGRTVLVRERSYAGHDAEREACEAFDNYQETHPMTDKTITGTFSLEEIERLMGSQLKTVNHWDAKEKEARGQMVNGKNVPNTFKADCYASLSADAMSLWEKLFDIAQEMREETNQ